MDARRLDGSHLLFTVTDEAAAAAAKSLQSCFVFGSGKGWRFGRALSAGSQEEWISGKDQRLGIAEPREKLELCAAAWVVLK